MKSQFSIGDALLCVTLAASLNSDIRETARRVQKRLPKVNRWPFQAIAEATDPQQQVRITVRQLTE